MFAELATISGMTAAQPKRLVAGPGEARVSGRPEVVITAHALGSCLGIACFDPVARVGGLFHPMLPARVTHSNPTTANPFLFVDEGFAALLEMLRRRGARPVRLLISVAGAARMGRGEEPDIFDIGLKNLRAFYGVLGERRLPICGLEVGGAISRTMSLRIRDGAVVIRRNGSIHGVPIAGCGPRKIPGSDRAAS